MRNPDSVEVLERENLRVEGYPILQINAEPNDRGQLTDLQLAVEGRPIANLERFAACSAYDIAKGSYPIILEYFAGIFRLPYLFLIGIFKIWFIAPVSLAASRAVLLHRSSKDDQAFYNLFIHEYDGFFLIRYESGVCRLNYDGVMEWHTALKWDDIYLGEDREGLFYSNEHLNDGKEWKIQMIDGRILMS